MDVDSEHVYDERNKTLETRRWTSLRVLRIGFDGGCFWLVGWLAGWLVNSDSGAVVLLFEL